MTIRQQPEPYRGKEILFGRYYYHANSDALLPIKWLPIAKTNTATLFLTKECIDLKRFSPDALDQKAVGSVEAFLTMYWANCEIRKWLNTEFLELAFTGDERQIILPAEHGEGCILGKNQTVTDYVFLLSRQEIMAYLADTSIRKAECTPYAAHKDETPEDPYDWWWTRNGGCAEYDGGTRHTVGLADVVTDNDTEDLFWNIEQADPAGVRPALWLINHCLHY